MIVRQRAKRAAIAVASASLIPLGLVAAPSVQAAPSAAEAAPASVQAATTYQGKVTTALNVRRAPTSAAAKVSTLKAGTKVTIQCKVFGPSVAGNSLWYKLSTAKWASARYIANVGTAPRFCGTGKEYQGKVVSSTALAVRSGPHSANLKVSSAPRGSTLAIVCKVDSQNVGGNTRWYQLTGDGGGQWVSARYVSNMGAIPPYC